MPYAPKTPHPGFIAARAGFTTGKDSPRDFLERGIAVIEARDADVHAFVVSDFTAARAAADAASKRYKDGNPLSLLDGCPLAAKDMIQTSDLPTQMGSALFKGWQAPVDAACVYALRQAGAVVVGKTVTTEFAAGHTNETRNPYDLARTPGGSSSGSGAAVGAGMVPLALGTQTRGSVIRPAAFSGAVGFKPSVNAIHTGGVHPLSPTLDHVGIIGAALDDVWAAAHIMAAVPGGVSGHHALSGTPDLPAAKAPRRLALLPFAEWNDAGAATLSAMEAALEKIRGAGCEIVHPDDYAPLATLQEKLLPMIDRDSFDIFAYEMQWPFAAYPPEKLNPRLQDLLARGRAVTERQYHTALAHRDALRALTQDFAHRFDGFVTLASTGPAPLGHDETGSRHYQVPWSYLGFPCFTLPVMAADELPLGLQIMGYEHAAPNLAAISRWIMDAVLP
ncbi:MAG: amidase [Alphaproteobacteria bacterium]|nr:amidase [Alphaproteobacteria bacterium]